MIEKALVLSFYEWKLMLRNKGWLLLIPIISIAVAPAIMVVSLSAMDMGIMLWDSSNTKLSAAGLFIVLAVSALLLSVGSLGGRMRAVIPSGGGVGMTLRLAVTSSAMVMLPVLVVQAALYLQVLKLMKWDAPPMSIVALILLAALVLNAFRSFSTNR